MKDILTLCNIVVTALNCIITIDILIYLISMFEIKKDLDILEDFIKLFEGEDLDGWIEFNFNYTREPEDSIDNYNGYVSLLKRIRNYLEELENGSNKD